MKFYLHLFIVSFSILANGQEEKIVFDTELFYRAEEVTSSDYDGFVVQYLNQKDKDKTAILLSELKAYYEVFNAKSYRQEILIIENQDSVFSVSKKDIFENEFVVNFSPSGIKNALFNEEATFTPLNEKGNYNSYTCNKYEFEIDQLGELLVLCIDENNKIDNVSTLIPESYLNGVKGLIVHFTLDNGYNFELTNIQNIKQTMLIDFTEANDLYAKWKQEEFKTSIDDLIYETVEAIDEIMVETPSPMGYDENGTTYYYPNYNELPSICRNSYQLRNDNSKLQYVNEIWMQGICGQSVLFQNEMDKLEEENFYTFLNTELEEYKKTLINSKQFDNSTVEENIQSLRDFIKKSRSIDTETLEDYDF